MTKLETMEKLGRLIEEVRAMRVVRWCHEWPMHHSEMPALPDFVAEFQAAHGPVPESAKRLLNPPAKTRCESSP